MSYASPAGSAPDTDLDWPNVAPEHPAPQHPAPQHPAADHPAPAAPASRPRKIGGAVALLVAGAIAGGLGVTAVHGSSTTATSNAAQPGQFGGPGGASGFGGTGGRPGQGGQAGTVGSVGTDTLTVTTSSGSTTYAVTSATQIMNSGSTVSLSSLAAGEQVMVMAGTSTSNGHPVAARILAGTPPTGAAPAVPAG
jgi:hypothetical protein